MRATMSTHDQEQRSTGRRVTRTRGERPTKPLGGEPDGEAAYAALVRALATDARVTAPREKTGKLGTRGCKVDGKVFAMWVRGALVVKLAPSEVDAAVAAGRGERLVMGKRAMKEWLVVHEHQRRWLALARRACVYVGGRR
jgi:hypothetical protein